VEPGWEYISSVNHDRKWNQYYRLNDLLTQEKDAEFVYRDSHNEFYHSIGGASSTDFRVLNWSFLATQDYKIGAKGIEPAGAPYRLCRGIKQPSIVVDRFHDFMATKSKQKQEEWRRIAALRGEDAVKKLKWIEVALGISRLMSQELSQAPGTAAMAKNIYHEATKESQEHLKELRQMGVVDVESYSILQAFFRLSSAEAIAGGELVSVFQKPILDPSGQYVAGVYNGSTKVFRINNNKTCSEVLDLGFESGKVSFGYDGSADRAPSFVFQHEGEWGMRGIGLYDSNSKKTVELTDPGRQIAFRNASYPNMTRDGRVLFVSEGQLIVIDPAQMSEPKLDKECVSLAAIDRVYSPLPATAPAGASK
jgi:hypothetical protein